MVAAARAAFRAVTWRVWLVTDWSWMMCCVRLNWDLRPRDRASSSVLITVSPTSGLSATGPSVRRRRYRASATTSPRCFWPFHTSPTVIIILSLAVCRVLLTVRLYTKLALRSDKGWFSGKNNAPIPRHVNCQFVTWMQDSRKWKFWPKFFFAKMMQ